MDHNYGNVSGRIMTCFILLAVAGGCASTTEESGKGGVEDLSWHFEHVVCEDPFELFGCKPTLIDAIDRSDLDAVKQLVEERGVDVNTHYPYYYGLTALMAAVQSKNEEMALYLLEQGADPDEVIPLDPLKVSDSQGLSRTAAAIRELRGE